MTMTMKKTMAETAMPAMPTCDDYRQGMKSMRAKLDCPVLSLEDESIADELRDYDWHAPTRAHMPAMSKPERPTVNDYLKKQYQANMLARYPDFECRTDNDIAQLKRSIDQMYSISVIIVALLLLVLFVGLYIALSFVV